MTSFTILANNTSNEHSDFVVTLKAKNVDSLNAKYGLSIFEQDDNYISALDKNEIAGFIKQNNIDFDVNAYDDVYLHIAK